MLTSSLWLILTHVKTNFEIISIKPFWNTFLISIAKFYLIPTRSYPLRVGWKCLTVLDIPFQTKNVLLVIFQFSSCVRHWHLPHFLKSKCSAVQHWQFLRTLSVYSSRPFCVQNVNQYAFWISDNTGQWKHSKYSWLQPFSHLFHKIRQVEARYRKSGIATGFSSTSHSLWLFSFYQTPTTCCHSSFLLHPNPWFESKSWEDQVNSC